MPELKTLGYATSKARLLPGYGDTDQKAIDGVLIFGWEAIPDCSYTKYGVDVLNGDTYTPRRDRPRCAPPEPPTAFPDVVRRIGRRHAAGLHEPIRLCASSPHRLDRSSRPGRALVADPPDTSFRCA